MGNILRLEKVFLAFEEVSHDEEKKQASKQRALDKVAQAEDESQRTPTDSQSTEPG